MSNTAYMMGFTTNSLKAILDDCQLLFDGRQLSRFVESVLGLLNRSHAETGIFREYQVNNIVAMVFIMYYQRVIDFQDEMFHALTSF